MERKRLVIRYEPGGQYTFGDIDPDADDGSLFLLALALNKFQDDGAEKVLVVRTVMFP